MFIRMALNRLKELCGRREAKCAGSLALALGAEFKVQSFNCGENSRVLHFGQEQLFWECSEVEASENLDKRLPMEIGTSLLRSLARKTGDTSYNTLINSWKAVLETYSEASLTRADDKLVAVSGIAKHFQPLLGNDEYIAGLWRGALASQLLWSVKDPATSKRAIPYRAPSFSWASVEASVEPHTYFAENSIMEILHVHITAVTKDPTGQIKNAFLRLRGSLKEFRPKKTTELIDPSNILDNLLYQIRYDTTEEGSTRVFLVPIYRPKSRVPETESQPRTRYQPTPVPAGLLTRSYGSGGLVLKAVTRPGLRGCYEQIGTFTTDRDFKREKDLFEDRQTNEAQIPCESFDEVSGKHTFILGNPTRNFSRQDICTVYK